MILKFCCTKGAHRGSHWRSRKIPILCCTYKTCSGCMIFCNSRSHLHRFIAVNLWLKYVQYFVHAPTWECNRGEGAGHRLRPIYGRWLWHIGHVQPTTQPCTSFRRWCGIKGISCWILWLPCQPHWGGSCGQQYRRQHQNSIIQNSVLL